MSYHQIDMSDLVNDYQKLYFEFNLLNLISMFDIFLRILENSFKFRFKQRVAQSQRLIPTIRGIEPKLQGDRR